MRCWGNPEAAFPVPEPPLVDAPDWRLAVLAALRMAPWGISSSFPLPDVLLLLVVRYSLVPGGRFAKLPRFVEGNCKVAITEPWDPVFVVTADATCVLDTFCAPWDNTLALPLLTTAFATP